MNSTDAKLLAAYLAGSDAAFHTLVTRHIGLVYAKARRQAPPAFADDITQAVFLLLAQRAKTIRNPALLPAWLLNATRFCAAEARRSDARRRKHEQKAAAMATPFTTDAPPTELDPHLDAALDTLSPADRTAIILRYVNDHSVPEVAAALTISEDAAKKRLARALEKLRAYFHRRQITNAAPFLTAALATQSAAAPPALAAKIATIALAKSTTATTASLLAKGATKLMAHATAKLVATIALSTGVLIAVGAPLLSPRHSASPAAPRLVPVAVPIATSAPAATYPLVRAIISPRRRPHDPPATIEVRDAFSHAPLPNVHIIITEEQQEFSPQNIGLTDASGTVRLPYPAFTYGSEILAAKDGYVPAGVYWSRVLPDDPAPDHFTLSMQKAVNIGGRVIDEDGHPLAGASVFVSDLSPRPIGAANLILPLATTDATGHWSLTATAPGARLAISASHPLCLTGTGQFQNNEAFVPDVLAGNHVLRLHRGVPVSGTVRDPDGRPHRASLRIGTFSGTAQSIPPIDTGEDGQFAIAMAPHFPLVIVAHAPGFADTTEVLTINDAPLHADVTLAPQSPLHARIVDPEGNPIPDARILITTWNLPDDRLKFGNYTLQSPWTFPVSLLSDAHGDVVWNDAPAQEVLAKVLAPGFRSTDWKGVPLKRDGRIVLRPQQVVRVRAVSAETNRTVTDFWLTPLGTGDFRSFPDGSVAFPTIRKSNYFVLGEHYLPEPLPEIPSDGRDYDLTLALTEGDRVTGTLVDSHGTPVPNARVGLDFDSRIDALEVTDLFLGELPHQCALTDHDGQFSFPPQTAAFSLFCGNEAGYAFATHSHFTGTLTLQPWATLTGTASHAGTVSIMRIGNPSLSTQVPTDAAGHFSIPHLAAGAYDVTSYFENSTGNTTRMKLRAGQTAAVTLTAP